MERLSAKSNDKIKSAVCVRDSVRTRKQTKTFFIEGARLCSDAAENNIRIIRSFFTAESLKKYAERCAQIMSVCSEYYEITDELACHLSDTQNPQGIFCICSYSDKTDSEKVLKSDGKYILLENLQDPSNLGAVARTAEALGIDALIVSGGCDVFNPKALRASMGSALRINIISVDNAKEFIEKANKNGILTLASTPDSKAVRIDKTDLNGGVICVVGNEGNGVTEETANVCRFKVTIPMNGRAESLNASTAAAIMIWEMVKQ